MDEEPRFIPLGKTPEDNVTSERYAEVLDELRAFAEMDVSKIGSIKDLSATTQAARKALRDVVVSVGRFDMPPGGGEVVIEDPEDPEKTAVAGLPGSYTYKAEAAGIIVSVNEMGGDDSISILKSSESRFDARKPEDREDILEIVRGYVLPLQYAVEAGLRGWDIGDGYDAIISTPPATNIEPASKEEDLIVTNILARFLRSIELLSLSPVVGMHLLVPATKDLDQCKRMEVEAFDWRTGIALYNPVDYPQERSVQRGFAELFQESIRDVLPTFPLPFVAK